MDPLLVRNFTFKVSSQLLAAIMAFVSLLVMTRYVADQYGVMIWGLALISLVNTVADLGFNSANLKFIAKEGYDKSTCFSTYIVSKAILTAIMVAITIVTVLVMKVTGAINEEAMWVCFVFVAYQIISNFQFAIYYTLDGMGMSGKSSVLTIVECGIRNTILIILALLYVDAIVLSSSYVIATTVSGIISVYMIYSVGLKFKKPAYMREYMVFAAPLAAALILTSVVSNLDKVIVGLFYESIEVTFYSTAVGLIATFTAVGVSLNNVLLPHLSKTITNDEMTEHTLWGLERGLCILLLPFIAFFLVLGPDLAAVLFGDNFRPSGGMIAVLSIQIIPFVIAGIMTQVLYAVNRGTAYLRASFILCIVSVIGLFLLIPNDDFMPFCMGYGGLGASAAIVLGYIVFMLVLIVMVRKYTGFRIYPKIWKVVLASAVNALVLYAVNYVYDLHGLILLVIAGLVNEILFIAILYAMHEIDKKDIMLVWKKFRDDED